MKKILVVLLTFLSIVTLVACSNTSKEDKTYDDDFITALGKGLDARWKYVDTAGDDTSAKVLKGAINKELDEVKEYKDKKFSDTKLQEQAIAYINELEEGLKVSETYGANSFDSNWDKHVGKRTSILLAINKIKEIPVQDKDGLSELLAQGKEVQGDNAKKEAIENLVKNITFTVNGSKSDEYTTYYSATVENTTNYNIKDIYLTINLVNADGVTVDTQYVSANNWSKGGKTLFEFTQFNSSDHPFTTTQISITSFDAEETE